MRAAWRYSKKKKKKWKEWKKNLKPHHECPAGSSANLQDTASRICPNIFIFPQTLVSHDSQKMPNHTNTLRHKTATLKQKNIWKIPKNRRDMQKIHHTNSQLFLALGKKESCTGPQGRLNTCVLDEEIYVRECTTRMAFWHHSTASCETCKPSLVQPFLFCGGRGARFAQMAKTSKRKFVHQGSEPNSKIHFFLGRGISAATTAFCWCMWSRKMIATSWLVLAPNTLIGTRDKDSGCAKGQGQHTFFFLASQEYPKVSHFQKFPETEISNLCFLKHHPAFASTTGNGGRWRIRAPVQEEVLQTCVKYVKFGLIGLLQISFHLDTWILTHFSRVWGVWKNTNVVSFVSVTWKMRKRPWRFAPAKSNLLSTGHEMSLSLFHLSFGRQMMLAAWAKCDSFVQTDFRKNKG